MKIKNLLMVFLIFALAIFFVGCKEDGEENPILVVGSVEITTAVDDTVKIRASVENTEKEYTLQYESDKPAVASVDEDGLITAKTVGVAIVTVSIKDEVDKKATVKVTVVAKPVAPTPTIDQFKPTSIVILGQGFIDVGDTSFFATIVNPAATSYKGLVWSSNNPLVASVDQEGNVTGNKIGIAIITAQSAIAPDVKADFEVVIKDTGGDNEVGEKIIAYLAAHMPKYVSESFELPVYPNPDATLTWFTSDGTELTDGNFVFDETLTEDSRTQVTCLVDYNQFSTEETFPLKLVADPENNNYENLELAGLYLDYLLADLMADGVKGDISLPTVLKGSTISWTSSKSDVISSSGVYVKPNDDMNISLTALVKSGPTSDSFAFAVVAKGYTEQEKINYLLEEGVLKALIDLKINTNVPLPTLDPRFGLRISWKSANTDVFADDGAYVNRDLAKDTDVEFTGTIKSGDVEFELDVKVTVKALKATDVSKAVYDFLQNDELLESLPKHFPYGRDDSNTIEGLPTTLAGHEGVTIEWEGNAEDFDGLTLKTQYLRYHESSLFATFKKGEDTPVVLTVKLNTGLAEYLDSVNVGGRFSEQASGVDLTIQYDLLSTFSYWDSPVGDQALPNQQHWSYFSGYTWYIDAETDRTTTLEQTVPGEGLRYQYFVMDFVTVYILDVDENGTVTEWDYANVRENTGGNWALFFVNLSGKEAKIPLAAHSDGQGTDGKDWKAFGSRENALTYDGFRPGFVANSDGEIITGNGFKVIQYALPSTTTAISIPVGGYGATFKTQENMPIVGVFCHVGTTLTIEKFSLAPENDYRAIYFKSNFANAEDGLDALEAGEDTTINIDLAISNAIDYSTNSRLTDLEKESFDFAGLALLCERSAAIWDDAIVEMQGKVAATDYLVLLDVFYGKFVLVADQVKDFMDEDLVEWLEDEYMEKLVKYNVQVHLNGGVYYTETRQEVIDLFLADLYEHLKVKGFTPLPEDAADLKAKIAASTIDINDTFLNTWIFEYWKDNHDHLTVDNNATQFIRQEAYNEKWTPLLWWLNDTVQIGHNGGRDLLGRVGEKYLFTYLSPTAYAGDIVLAGNAARFKEYVNGVYAYAAYKEAFLEETWTVTPEYAQEKFGNIEYTPGDVEIDLETPMKPGFTFGGWFSDEACTQAVTLTPAGLGYADAVIYAKWTSVPAE